VSVEIAGYESTSIWTDLFVDKQTAEAVLLDALSVLLCAHAAFATSCIANDNLAFKMTLRCKNILPDA